MKICAIICEYNPFHNGHLHQLRQAKLLSGADAMLCLMSGNFVQRGESAILDKFTRAKHALLAGADVVVELPTPFACSSAEIFAKGAVKLLASIPSVTHLCFGAENANKQAFIDTATSLLNESGDISKKIKIGLAKGLSFAKARAQAYDNPLLSSPNNILGVEYTKAILQSGRNIEILPILRIGSGYLDKRVDAELPSASAIREALTTSDKESISNAVPSYVYEALPTAITDNLDSLEKAAILQKSESEISTVLDCNEGLENALKKAAILPAPLTESLTSARYTASRIRRIALHNLLGIKKTDIETFLSDDLFLYPLGYKKDSKAVLTALSESKYPLLTSAKTLENLSTIGRKCRDLINLADKIYAVATGKAYQSNVVIL